MATAGTSEFAKKYKPQPGDLVSFKHHGYLLGTKKPKMPLLFRLRPDLDWKDVVQMWTEPKAAITGTFSVFDLLLNSSFRYFLFHANWPSCGRSRIQTGKETRQEAGERLLEKQRECAHILNRFCSVKRI